MAGNAIPAVEVTGPLTTNEVATPVILIEPGEGVVARQNAIPVYFVEPGPGVRIAQQDPTPMAVFAAGTVVTSARNAIPVWSVGGPPTPPGPTNTVAPVISGTPEVGQTLTTTNGTWTGTGTITYAYQWVNSVGGDIGGATASTYLLQASDEGDNITCRVTATDDNGSASAVSNSLGPIAPVAARTYDDWVTQAAVLAPTSDTWTGNLGTAGTRRTTVTTPSGTMQGTTFNTGTTGANSGSSTGTTAVLARAVQHAFPDQTTFDENVAAGRVIVHTVVNTTLRGPFVGINRNGFSSTSEAGTNNGRSITNIKYWDAALGKVRQWDPSVNGPITDYVW